MEVAENSSEIAKLSGFLVQITEKARNAMHIVSGRENVHDDQDYLSLDGLLKTITVYEEALKTGIHPPGINELMILDTQVDQAIERMQPRKSSAKTNYT